MIDVELKLSGARHHFSGPAIVEFAGGAAGGMADG
jgi:hypothetical protein